MRFNVATLVDAETILARLKSAEIPSYRMESGAGSYLTITAGLSLAGNRPQSLRICAMMECVTP